MHFLSSSSVPQLGQVRINCSTGRGAARTATVGVSAVAAASCGADGEPGLSEFIARILARLGRAPPADILLS